MTELCLNHKSGVSSDPLVQIYQQHDYAKEVAAAFEKWSAHVESLIAEPVRAAAGAPHGCYMPKSNSNSHASQSAVPETPAS